MSDIGLTEASQSAVRRRLRTREVQLAAARTRLKTALADNERLAAANAQLQREVSQLKLGSGLIGATWAPPGSPVSGKHRHSAGGRPAPRSPSRRHLDSAVRTERWNLIDFFAQG